MLGFDHKYIEKAKNVQEKSPERQDYNIFRTRLQYFSLDLDKFLTLKKTN